MDKFGTTYNLNKIYNNSQAFESDNIDIKSKSNNILQVFKTTDAKFDFDKVCKLCIRSK